MTKFITAAALAALSLLAACSPEASASATADTAAAPVLTPITHSNLVIAYARMTDRMAAEIEKVHDQKSAEYAAMVISATQPELSRIQDQLQALPVAEGAAMMTAGERELEAATVRLAGSMAKAGEKDPQAMLILAQEVAKLPPVR